jgi:uncharacterized membrane protein YozB (DUF420 family)
MATIPYSTDADRGEARFFFTMACLTTAIIVSGFSFNIVMGRSSFALPWVYHFHGIVMMGGLALYVAQSSLILAGNVALHRRLGWVAVVWVPLMVFTGLLLTRISLQERGGPPFFDKNQFLISNPLHLLGFGFMVAWAITVRRNTGWHRRLMLCGFAMLLGPGIGRILPNPLLIPYAWYADAVVPPLLFALIGILADRRRYGRAHPAWFWGIGVLVGIQLIADLVAYSPLGYQFTEWFLAGTPGAERQMEAFVPPM